MVDSRCVSEVVAVVVEEEEEGDTVSYAGSAMVSSLDGSSILYAACIQNWSDNDDWNGDFDGDLDLDHDGWNVIEISSSSCCCCCCRPLWNGLQ